MSRRSSPPRATAGKRPNVWKRRGTVMLKSRSHQDWHQSIACPSLDTYPLGTYQPGSSVKGRIIRIRYPLVILTKSHGLSSAEQRLGLQGLNPVRGVFLG